MFLACVDYYSLCEKIPFDSSSMVIGGLAQLNYGDYGGGVGTNPSS